MFQTIQFNSIQFNSMQLSGKPQVVRKDTTGKSYRCPYQKNEGRNELDKGDSNKVLHKFLRKITLSGYISSVSILITNNHALL